MAGRAPAPSAAARLAPGHDLHAVRPYPGQRTAGAGLLADQRRHPAQAEPRPQFSRRQAQRQPRNSALGGIRPQRAAPPLQDPPRSQLRRRQCRGSRARHQQTAGLGVEDRRLLRPWHLRDGQCRKPHSRRKPRELRRRIKKCISFSPGDTVHGPFGTMSTGAAALRAGTPGEAFCIQNRGQRRGPEGPGDGGCRPHMRTATACRHRHQCIQAPAAENLICLKHHAICCITLRPGI